MCKYSFTKFWKIWIAYTVITKKKKKKSNSMYTVAGPYDDHDERLKVLKLS